MNELLVTSLVFFGIMVFCLIMASYHQGKHDAYVEMLKDIKKIKGDKHD